MRRAVPTVLFLLAAASVSAQSLGELAEREKQKRTGKTAGSYTDEDLARLQGEKAKPPAAKPGAKAGTAKPGAKPGAASPIPAPSAAASPSPGPSAEAQWRARQERLQGEIRKAEQRVAELKARLGDLMQDTNPMSADVLDPSRLQKRAAEQYALQQEQIPAAEKAVEAAKQALADFEEEARRAGIPPGWLR